MERLFEVQRNEYYYLNLAIECQKSQLLRVSGELERGSPDAPLLRLQEAKIKRKLTRLHDALEQRRK